MSATECRVCGNKSPLGHDCRDEFEALRAESERLREALERIANTVDEALLLDEDLDQAWGELRQAVIEARSAGKSQ